jgi:hypothetical protein
MDARDTRDVELFRREQETKLFSIKILFLGPEKKNSSRTAGEKLKSLTPVKKKIVSMEKKTSVNTCTT